MANWGASRGGAVGAIALNAGAAMNATFEASGMNLAGQAGAELRQGDVGSSGLHLAMALPLGRGGKLLLSRGAGILPAKEAGQLAAYVGYSRRAKGVPFNSHGQPVYTNGKNYITPDIDSHNGGVWKMFDKRGNQTGTYDALLTKIKE